MDPLSVTIGIAGIICTVICFYFGIQQYQKISKLLSRVIDVLNEIYESEKKEISQ